MIVGELVPEIAGAAGSDPHRALTVLPMQWSLRLFAWSIVFLNGSGVLLLRLLRVPSTGHRHVHSPEEIELLIAESRDGGLLEPEEQVRLHRALRLGLRTARQLMVPRARLAALDVDDAVRRGAPASSPPARTAGCRSTAASLDDVVGMLHTKDVVTDFISERRATSLASLLRPIVRVHDSMPADRLLAFLRERRSHQALVVDDERHGRSD